MMTCTRCGSYAINHHSHGRDGSDGDLCDVCYWRKRCLHQISEPANAGWCDGCSPDNCGGCVTPASPVDADVQQDAERLDFLIEQRAYVVSDPSICDGYWLHYARPNGETWVQSNEHTTPRAAIDAARAERIK